ncbi:unnamed protein product [Peniophora sp. CBMAI 1063]|nr:unnamed protein product [Peniophora sp. CBMAI 1063]
MPPKPPSDFKPSSKRRSEGSDIRASKRPRSTINNFFAPQITVYDSPGIDGMTRGASGGSANVTLSVEQRQVLKMVVEEGKNIFFTGSAGTGKSLLLKAIIASLRRKYAKTPEAVAVTASTGMAASNVGGQTIHAWGAISPTVEDMNKLERDIRCAKPALARWKKTVVLVIDEVSMVDGHLFDRIAGLAVRLRKQSQRPLGGIQLVITGDFFQLPPVTKNGKQPFFAFESEAWKKVIDHTVVLTQVFRQKDTTFIDLLNELRHGTLTPSATDTFKQLSRPLGAGRGRAPPTELFPLRNEVERANAARLDALRTPPHRFIARDSGNASEERRKSIFESMMAPQELVLKTGAQVMLIRNVDDRRHLVNGSVGRVLGFFPAQGGKANGVVRDIVLDADGKLVSNAPVKREGNKEDKKSRPSGAGLSEEKFPYVEFLTPSGRVTVLVTRDEFRVEDSEGKVLARRLQVPLILAWAISIHKSQGQTIQRVKIDLGRVFEKGQSYVALSRAATMDGLQVLGFDPKKVVAHPKVIEWSKTLQSFQTTALPSVSDSLQCISPSTSSSSTSAPLLSASTSNCTLASTRTTSIEEEPLQPSTPSEWASSPPASPRA